MPRFVIKENNLGVPMVIDTHCRAHAARFAAEYREFAEEMMHRLNVRYLATLDAQGRREVRDEVRCQLSLCGHRCSCAGESPSHPIEYKPEEEVHP